MHRIRCRLLAAVLVLLTASCSSGESTTSSTRSPQAPSASPTQQSPSGSLASRISPGGSLRVIVTLAGSFVPEGELPDEAARVAQRSAISDAQSAVLKELAPTRVSAIRRFAYTPQLALTVDAAALEQLLRSQRVAAVQEDTAQSQPG